MDRNQDFNSKNARRKSRKKAYPPLLLVLSALAVPCANVLLFDLPRQILRYYGGMNAYRPLGAALLVGGEICEVIYTVVYLCAMIFSVMTLGRVACRGSFGRALIHGFFYLIMSAAAQLLRIGVFALLVTLGVSDSTVSLKEQLPAGMATFAISLAALAVFTLIALISYAAVSRAAKKQGLFTTPKTAYMIVSYLLAAIYTLFLIADGVYVALNYTAGENFFTGAVLPVLYPLIYGALMILTALFYRLLFAKKSGKIEETGK